MKDFWRRGMHMMILQCCACVRQCNLTLPDKIRCLKCAGFVETRPFTSNEAVVQSRVVPVYKLSFTTAFHIGSTVGVMAIINLRPLFICVTIYMMIYEILQSAHRPSDSRWRLIFSLPISTLSALGVSHVMRCINVRYLLTYLLTYMYVTNCDWSLLQKQVDWLIRRLA